MSLTNSYFFLLCMLATRASVIKVEPTSTNCSGDIPQSSSSPLQVLLSNITSNAILRLEPGCHFLDRSIVILDKTNVTIEGLGRSSDNVTVSCNRSVGLAFVNTSELTLRMLTISECGLTGSVLNETLTVIKKDYMSSFESIFKFDSNFQIGLFIAISRDVLLDNINIERTRGFGFVAVNVINSLTIESCRFAYNHNVTCFSSPDYGVSGGAVIVFQDGDDDMHTDDTILSIRNTEFLNNSNCALDSQRQTYSSRVSISINSIEPYSPGGGGGLTVYLANYEYSTSVNAVGCVFQNNTGVTGGGVFIGTFAGISNNSITIKDSIFLKNGFEFGGISNYERHITVGQGLFILKDIRLPIDLTSILVGVNEFKIANCSFQENVATSTAGVVVLSHYLTTGEYSQSDTFLFDKCNFTGNRAYTTPALLLFEAKQSGIQSGIQITISDTVFNQNIVLTTHFMLSALSINRLNLFEATAVRVILSGMNNFTGNNGTPFDLRSSILEINGVLSFDKNYGNLGGGLALTLSYIVLHKNSHVLFSNNHAYLQAGAIYLDVLGGYDCFLFFGYFEIDGDDSICEDPKHLNVTMTFRNNTAPISNVAYGSTLKSCPWVQFLNSTYKLYNTTDPYRMLEAIGVFEFTPSLDEDSLSTPAVYLAAKVNSKENLMPGQQVSVDVSAYDGFDQKTLNFISSTVLDESAAGDQDSQLGDTSYWFINRNRLSHVPVSVRSKKPIAKVKNIEIGIYSLTSTAANTIDLNITHCYGGFEFPKEANTNATYKTCICNKQLQLLHPKVSCNEQNATIVVSSNYWLGYVNNRTWILNKCLSDYCTVGISVIRNSQFDVQCQYNRTGILCGKCQKGFSVKIGTNECGKCSNFSLFWFLYIVLEGLVLITVVGTIGVTVSYGYINSLLFFANVIGPFANILFPNKILFFPINILDNGLGFFGCLFDGMTALDLTYIEFMFPGYLYILVLLYTICGRHCRNSLRKWTPNSPQVFATVFLLTYTSLLSTCFKGMTIIPLDIDDGSTLRWTVDPNVKYFSPGHAILAVISVVVFVLYLVPATLMLLFPSLVLRTTIGKKFLPIYEAFWAPFKEKRHFWVSFRLLLRFVPIMLAIYIPKPANFLYLGIFVIIYIFVHIVFDPFIRDVQNIVDIYLNLCILLLLAGPVQARTTEELQTVLFSVAMCLVYFAIAFILIHHLYINFKCLQIAVASFKQKYLQLKKRGSSKKCVCENNAIFWESDRTSLVEEDENSDHRAMHTVTDLRDTLLEQDLYI